MDSLENVSEEKLPNRCEFYSYLKDRYISERYYLHAINVWNVFKINAMGDYHNLYLKTDVLLLNDVFENFISTCLAYHELDPCHYKSSLGLSWGAILKMTEIELELISYIDIYLFIEKGEWEEEFLALLNDLLKQTINAYNVMDANNLYGREMSRYLP